MVVNIAYDYRITIIIREYEICTEHKIHMDCVTPRFLGLTRLADPNRVRDARLYTGTLYLIVFFFSELNLYLLVYK